MFSKVIQVLVAETPEHPHTHAWVIRFELDNDATWACYSQDQCDGVGKPVDTNDVTIREMRLSDLLERMAVECLLDAVRDNSDT
jgi:hypothetical protein